MNDVDIISILLQKNYFRGYALMYHKIYGGR